MTDLPLLREALAKMTEGPWLDNGTEATDEDCQETIIETSPRYTGVDFEIPVAGDMDRRRADIAGIVTLVNAAPALLTLAQRALEAEAETAKLANGVISLTADNLQLRAEVARLTALLHRVVMLLDASSCYSCGAEPGCNIDCGLCHLTAELQREGLAPKERDDERDK